MYDRWNQILVGIRFLVELGGLKLQLQLQVLHPLIFQLSPQPRNLLLLRNLSVVMISLYRIHQKLHLPQLLLQAPFQYIQSRQHPFPTATVVVHFFHSCSLLDNRFSSKPNLFNIVWKHRVKFQAVLIEVPPTYPSLLHLHGGIIIIIIFMQVTLTLLVPFLHTGQPLQHILHQKIGSLTVLKERVFEQLISSRSLGRILVETRSHHVLECLRELLPIPLPILVIEIIGETKPLGDLEHHGLGRWKVREGRPSMRKLQRGYPKGPYISLETVTRV